MLDLLYRGLGMVLTPVLDLLRPLVRLQGGRLAHGFDERLGRYPKTGGGAGPRVWMHASSVGETQAAIILISALLRNNSEIQLILTATTEQGNRLARSRLPGTVTCLMAPLDAPRPVERAIAAIRPDLYVCLETELWPVLLTALHRAGVVMLLLNGRLSERSFARYRRVQPMFAELLAGFAAAAVISGEDGRRYAGLGLPGSRIRVLGNLKYDMPAEDAVAVRARGQRRLAVSGERVFVCGSTRSGEEALLLPVYRHLAAVMPLVWVIAPRHLERLAEVEALLAGEGLAWRRWSGLDGRLRSEPVILVDTMGELADLYCAADYVFCGGSLVPCGGHNVMEAARWGRPVCFGPHMKDFRDAAELLTASGGGFQVADAGELAGVLLHLHAHPEAYVQACRQAGAAAAGQRGAVDRQMRLILEHLAEMAKNTSRYPLFPPVSAGK